MPGYVRSRGKRQDGTTKWQARWRHPDDPSIREEKTFRNKTVADRWVTKMESDAHAGMYRSGATANRTFAEAVEAWRETRASGLAPKSRARYEQIIRTYLDPAFGDKKLTSLTREVVKRYFARLEKNGTTPGTIRKIHTTLSAIFTEAIDLEITSVNPATGALRGRKKVEQHEMLFLDRDEITALADVEGPRSSVH